MIDVVNISLYAGCNFHQFLPLVLVKLRGKKLFPYEKNNIDNIEMILSVKPLIVSCDTLRAMVDIGNMVLQYTSYHEAFYFYHKAWTLSSSCSTYTNINSHAEHEFQVLMEHNALLQMARIIRAIGDNSVAITIFNELVSNYGSEEAKSHLDDDNEEEY